jgi:hypothetical protein
MRFPGAGPGGAVAAKHRLGAPAGEAHEVGSLAAGGATGARTAELVRMQTFAVGLEAAPANDLRKTRVGDRTLGPIHSSGEAFCRWRARARTYRSSGCAALRPERHRAVPATLAPHPRDVVAEVHVLELHRGDLGAPRPGIVE